MTDAIEQAARALVFLKFSKLDWAWLTAKAKAEYTDQAKAALIAFAPLIAEAFRGGTSSGCERCRPNRDKPAEFGAAEYTARIIEDTINGK